MLVLWQHIPDSWMHQRDTVTFLSHADVATDRFQPLTFSATPAPEHLDDVLNLHFCYKSDSSTLSEVNS